MTIQRELGRKIKTPENVFEIMLKRKLNCTKTL